MGIENLAKLLRSGGMLYLSTPIVRERIEFNVNWVKNPINILSAANSAGLLPHELIVLNQQGIHMIIFPPTEPKLYSLAKEHYALGKFFFEKTGLGQVIC